MLPGWHLCFMLSMPHSVHVAAKAAPQCPHTAVACGPAMLLSLPTTTHDGHVTYTLLLRLYTPNVAAPMILPQCCLHAAPCYSHAAPCLPPMLPPCCPHATPCCPHADSWYCRHASPMLPPCCTHATPCCPMLSHATPCYPMLFIMLLFVLLQPISVSSCSCNSVGNAISDLSHQDIRLWTFLAFRHSIWSRNLMPFPLTPFLSSLFENYTMIHCGTKYHIDEEF